ncbi:MAG: serine/threonine protein kinase [Planctomycetes bacterium]|nr:serine/threonine protein kinase [Planctomycetota bacterium]
MLDPRHDLLRRLFDQASELPTADQAAFVARACAGDDALGHQLTALLAAAADQRFLATPTTGPAADPVAEGPGTRIGSYTLLQQIGEGGFGVVFLAEQSEPVQRRVALKIVKLGMDTRQLIARFEQERQALALMDHPHIAKVLDAGATASGRPYFVMEYVAGEPITTWCDRQQLPIEERLSLFTQVCQAVQHAHGKGVIHRDLKPSNVLAFEVDGRPQVKVIDFGIAKATQKLTERTLVTELQQVIGTFLYMSPEQATGSADVDTRSDVYALGVLLYELLTGTTPFERRTLAEAMLGEVQRLICEVDPPRPSTRLGESRERLTNVAAHRRVEPGRLGLLVRGDLDWIVMKAIEKDRTRRYETASELARDVQRHLIGDPVLAAPPGAAYRLRKLVRRHRGAVLAGVAAALTLLGGVVAFAWQARVASTERDHAVTAGDEAKRQRGLAEQRAAQLAQVVTFQESMLEQVDPVGIGIALACDLRSRHEASLAAAGIDDAERPAAIAAFQRELARVNATDAAATIVDRALLRPAVLAVEQQFGDQPLVEATLRATLARAYARLGRHDTHHDLQAQALAIRERLLGDEHLDTAAARNDLANALERQGHKAAAESLYRAALATRRQLLGEDHPVTVKSLGNLGGNLRSQSRLDEAEPLLVAALAAARRVLGDEHRDTLVCMNQLGYLRIEQGRPAEAEPFWREAHDTGRRVFGVDDADAIVWINNYGGLLGQLGRLGDAEAHYREALAATRQRHGEEHPFHWQCMANLAANLVLQGRFGEAEPLLKTVLDSRRRALGPEHPESLHSLQSLGSLWRQQGRLADAEPLLVAAFGGLQRLYGASHLDTLRAGSILAVLYGARDRVAEAEALYRRLLDAAVGVLGEEHPDRLVVLNNFGNLLAQSGRHAEAEPLLREMLTVRTRVSGADHPETLVAMSSYARVREQLGHVAEAEGMFRDAAARFRRVLGEQHANTLSSIQNLGNCLAAQRRHAEAEPLLREAVMGFGKAVGEVHVRTATSRRMLGRVLTGLARFAEAEVELLAAERVFAAGTGGASRRAAVCDSLVELHEAWHATEPAGGHDVAAANWRARAAELRAEAVHK